MEQVKPDVVERRFYSVEDVMKIFNLGRNKVLSLMKLDGFPFIKFGNTYRVDSVKLDEWIEAHYGETIQTKEN